MSPFLLAVITRPLFFPGEAACLEVLLAAGLERLHLRKPGATEDELEALLKQIDSRWYSRLVLHGSGDLQPLAVRYGIPQMHCPPGGLEAVKRGSGRPGLPGAGNSLALSASLHSWEEIKEVKDAGLTYVFMSPVFNSISKRGYRATPGLLQRPPGPFPCKVLGLGGVDKDTIGELVREGWEGAAVLGWIWEDPDRAVQRYLQLKETIMKGNEKNNPL
ncbi:MAG TPA: thiamine phosphate synthase [Puia sp.]|jgi:thiamine-phosphate pyrophosphorylase|nr:thiamine phosphate synthase [Puia sp.]